MKAAWKRFEDWLTRHAPAVLEGLYPGATAAEIEDVEKKLGVQLPQSMRDFYSIHNGQDDQSPSFMRGTTFLKLDQIHSEWSVWKDLLDKEVFIDFLSEPDSGIRSDWWNPKWIPLTYDGSGNHFCLDCDPAPGGTSGQIITMWHDAPERNLQARSFEEWIRDFADGLESGRFVYSEDYFAIVPIEDV
ncbi:MAG TPA: SMI1/KNR4 family protein [Drouetiella sp.]|jgi:cell wall assembly regulator SMI1